MFRFRDIDCQCRGINIATSMSSCKLHPSCASAMQFSSSSNIVNIHLDVSVTLGKEMDSKRIIDIV